uniref:Uncharacterized protein n=1 Tax=Arundo donax TaxID=35708 RepID=A0A0A9CV76_ARUDO
MQGRALSSEGHSSARSTSSSPCNCSSPPPSSSRSAPSPASSPPCTPGSASTSSSSSCPSSVSAFLTGLFHSRLVKRVLVVAPKTLLAHWTMELSVVGLKDKIRLLWPQHKYPQLRASLCFQGGWYSPNNL